MGLKSISRRQFVKRTGALVIGFNLFGSRLLAGPQAQSASPSGREPEVTSLDSWLAIGQDGNVTVYTSKVDLGTGVLTALSQIVAEELDIPFERVHMKTGDTASTIDQSQTSGSRTVHKAGPQLRQAAAAGRRALLNLASARFGLPVENLTVDAGVISVISRPQQKVSYEDLIGGRRFNLKITATGTGAELRFTWFVVPCVVR